MKPTESWEQYFAEEENDFIKKLIQIELDQQKIKFQILIAQTQSEIAVAPMHNRDAFLWMEKLNKKLKKEL